MKNIDITGSYHKPFWFPFASVYVPVTPCVLDGSLSFLEMVWKLLRDLNKTIEATNANHTDILTLVDEINKLYGSKLSYIVVNFTQPNPMLAEITADTDYTDIVNAYAEGIVLGQFNGDLYIALGYDSDNKVVSFYSLNGVNLRRIEDNENRVSYYNEQIITNNGGTITGILNLTRMPAAGNEAANKKYVDDRDVNTLQEAEAYADQQDAITLQAAKTYADKQDTITLQAAKTYADQQDEITLQAAKTYAEQQDEITLQAAKTYADKQGTIALQAAKTYADQQDEITLQDAKTYADQNFVRNNGNSGNTYASRDITEAEFTNIPTAPDTITITALLAKLARWYDEIKNKITLQDAKTYADQQDEITLQAAKTYAEQQDEFTLQAAKTYADKQGTNALLAAKTYADQQDEITLQAAKTYADQNFVRTNGDSGNTYASRNSTESTFTNIPVDSSITISRLLAKLARWYDEIKNKITRAIVTIDNDVYKCDKTFAMMYELITDGQEVQIAFNDPLTTVGTSIMRLERYNNTVITFTGDNHTCTINNSDVITFS